MPRYALYFDPRAKKEWDALDGSLKAQFRKILKRRLECPHVSSSALSGSLQNCYKIKLRQAGYRLVYQVDDGQIIVLVVAIGRRDQNVAYHEAEQRL